jgi:hypothetical protein
MGFLHPRKNKSLVVMLGIHLNDSTEAYRSISKKETLKIPSMYNNLFHKNKYK